MRWMWVWLFWGLGLGDVPSIRSCRVTVTACATGMSSRAIVMVVFVLVLWVLLSVGGKRR